MRDTRLRINAPEDLQRRVRRIAENKNESVHDYVCEAIRRRIEDDKHPTCAIEHEKKEKPKKPTSEPVVDITQGLQDLEEYAIRLKTQHASELEGFLNRIRILRRKLKPDY